LPCLCWLHIKAVVANEPEYLAITINAIVAKHFLDHDFTCAGTLVSYELYEVSIGCHISSHILIAAKLQIECEKNKKTSFFILLFARTIFDKVEDRRRLGKENKKILFFILLFARLALSLQMERFAMRDEQGNGVRIPNCPAAVSSFIASGSTPLP
jgi:hypothetical protein